MTNKCTTFFALIIWLLSLGSLAIASTPAPPPIVTVTDAGAPESPRFHFTQFSTVPTATVANGPVATQETTVDGPHYSWTCSNPSPGFSMSGGDSSANYLNSSGQELTAGNNDVRVSCTVTWKITNTTTNVVTSVSCSGSTDVTFFVKIPIVVVQISNTNVPGSPYSGPNLYGHDQAYHLQVQDNHPNPQPYTNGQAREEKVAGTIYNGPAPASTAFGPYSTDPFGGKPAGVWSCSDFTDYIGCSTIQNLAALYGWNVITLQIAWDQKFWCDEPTGHTTPLNTFHIRNDYQTATRN